MRRMATLAVAMVCMLVTATLPLQGQIQTSPLPPANNGLIIPAGTNVSIRTNEAITAKDAQVGQAYAVQIAQPVADANGNSLIPQGAPAQIVVVNTGRSMLGGNELGLALQSVALNGHNYMVNTQAAQQQQQSTGGIGANKRTAIYVGGGALLGTLVGAMAGGGKGAAIGAILGGVGGAAAQVLTRGRQLNVPAESVLTFKLDQPVQLTP